MNKSTWLNDNIKPILAVAIVVLSFGYFFMCSIRNIKPDPQILIAFVAAVSGVTGYYYGSSQGSSKKDDALVDSVNKPAIVQTGDQPVANTNTAPDAPTPAA